MGGSTNVVNAKWVKTVTYAKDDVTSSSKTLSYLYPSDKWGGYCSLIDTDYTVCGATAENYG
ncbi:MAG: hypothetical protein QF704_03020 [Anaerolineales bacterium]|jgi:hypothetical protein|nr:hypothetical protein [Anaerolineales bacterium]